VKRPVMALFFGYCFWRGWVGRCGLVQGLFASSYLDMLAVPLRTLPGSPLHGKAYFYASYWVDSGARLTRFLWNCARGKAKFPTSIQDLTGMMMPGMAGSSGMPGMPGMAGTPGSPGASPWAAADGAPDLGAFGNLFGDLAAEPTLGAMPTAPTVAPVTSPMATMASTPMASTAPTATAASTPMASTAPTATASPVLPMAEAVTEAPAPVDAASIPPPPPRKAPTVIDVDVAFLD